jgi:small subunit ribosomal protein S30e
MGKVHGSLARAGKVRNQTPKVEKQEKKKRAAGRAKKRIQYNRRFLNVVTGGKSHSHCYACVDTPPCLAQYASEPTPARRVAVDVSLPSPTSDARRPTHPSLTPSLSLRPLHFILLPPGNGKQEGPNKQPQGMKG